MGRDTGGIWYRVFKRQDGKWWWRVVYRDEDGRRRDLQRRAKNRIAAYDELQKFLDEYKKTGGRVVVHERKTFRQLSEHYEKEYMRPAKFIAGRKLPGTLRSHKLLKYYLVPLREHFGEQLVRKITHRDIEKFKEALLQTPTRRGGQRSFANVHRVLALLRRILNIAVQEGWIATNPFRQGGSLISAADEVQRQRILDRDEETRLLAACDENWRREHLKPVLILLLDTGARLGEALRLTWADVDLAESVITIRAENTKTLTPRLVGITSRLRAELDRIRPDGVSPSAPVFGGIVSVKSAFSGAKKTAGIDGLRLHDLRHSCASRLVEQGLALPEVARILGHTSERISYRYSNVDKHTLKRAAMALDKFSAAYPQQGTEGNGANAELQPNQA